MEVETDFSCRNCEYREELNEKSETATTIRHGKTSRQCSHKSNCDAYEIASGRIGYNGPDKDGCHDRQRNKLKLTCYDNFQPCDDTCSRKLSGRENQSTTSYRYSSMDPGHRPDDSFCMDSNYLHRCSHSTLQEIKKQSCKRSFVCSCHCCIHTNSTMVPKHSCFDCSQRGKRPCHCLHFHDSKRRQHGYDLIKLDGCASLDEMTNRSPCCKHRCCYHCQGSIKSHEKSHSNPHEDTICSPSTIGIQKQLVSTMTGPIISNSSPSLDYVVYGLNVPAVENEHILFGHDSGSQNINEWKSGLMSSCNIITQETENKKHQDEWLKLSLKIFQGTRQKVEGFSKDDLKLSLPDAKEYFNGSNCFDSLESRVEELKQVGLNACSTQTCYIYYPNRGPEMDTSSCHQSREKNCLEVQHTMTCMPDSNLPPNTTDAFSIVSTSASLGYNTHRREESQSVALNQISTQGYSVHEESGFDRPCVLPDQMIMGSMKHITIPCDGLSNNFHQGGTNSKESSHFCAPECKLSKNKSFPFSGNNEVVANQIDCGSEDTFSKQNMIQILPSHHNSVRTCEKGSACEDILSNHDTVLSYDKNLKGNLRPVNEIGTRSTNKTNDETNIVQLHYSRSTEYSAQHSGLDAQWPVDGNIIVDISSSGNECVDNTPDNTLQPASPFMKDRGEYEPQGDVPENELENDTVDSKNPVISISVHNHKSVHNVSEGGSVGTRGLQENSLPCKCPSTPNGGDHPIVHNMKTNLTVLEHNLIDSQIHYSKHSSHDRQEAEANRNIQMWDKNIICDLCGQGPSLMYGEWYAWCCGWRSRYCKCSEEHKQKLLKSMEYKKAKSSHKWKGYQWSGKVHRMCGLWSSEVFEKDDTRDQFEGLLVAVRKARSFVCAECKRFGATLGCGEKTCKKIFHYPCADWLSTKLCCRMWEGFKCPIICYYHLHDDYRETAKDRKIHTNMKYIINPDLNGTIRENIAHQNITVKDDPDVKNRDVIKAISDNVDVGVSRKLSKLLKVKTEVDSTISNQGFNDKAIPSRTTYGGIKYLGRKLICEDISKGTEMIKIPCTNDRDKASIPKFHYIPTNRFSTQSTVILKNVQSDMEKQAKACDGCDEFDMDDPEAGISIHVHGCIRDQDDRIDWQGEPMLGRLAYDRFGRLQLGTGTPDVIECNSRCPCGSKCLNRKLQYGLRVRLEVFRTQNRKWGVRVLEQIPRGQFVVEYVGEVLSPEEATERENLDDNYNARYLFSMDHPSVPPKDQLVVDIYGMSNVVRFINHSSTGNLSIYRVYAETIDPKIYRLGLYACRDIEAGEELTYDYKIPMPE